MTRLLRSACLWIVAFFTVSAVTGRAKAQGTDGASALAVTGVVTYNIGYVPSLVVVLTSDRAADRYLLIPVAGPWLDLATRGCGTCNRETHNRTLLITDGAFQGLGALFLGAGIAMASSSSSASAAQPRFGSTSFDVLPASFEAGGYGFVAQGVF